MKIEFESSHERFKFVYRMIGSSGRYDTITDCVFLSDTKIVCADRQMATLYLIEFDLSNNNYKILNTKECIIDGKPKHFELMCIHGENKIRAVSLDNTILTFEIVDNNFINFKLIPVNKYDAYHGICPADNDSVFVTNVVESTITNYNLNTLSKNTMYCKTANKIKDGVMIDDDHILLLSSNGSPVSVGKEKEDEKIKMPIIFNSYLGVFNIKREILVSNHLLSNSQVDSCIYVSPYCYITHTGTHGEGSILRYKIDKTYKFSEEKKFPCGKFPHGIAHYRNMIAYTSYKESALYIKRLKENGDIEL